MKASVHPKYYDDATVTCSCGNTFTTGSTKDHIRVEVCSKCHPFYTGQMKFVDSVGRVGRFNQKREAAKKTKAILVEKKLKKERIKKEKESPKTLREMLLGM